ncbi:hypothetical protein SAMN04515647_4286 [Cohaesibacter sp. ES.047]|uniref:hypothetical protein n=1 Tax=Cohaesibacter sp. ES.047 TaxID=1798205 RepID=UPI000BB9B89A|nr:hypothetical protein [Cohaesibacter sp. ES.047]SNY93963.1 hypothetical protein SAMN04515647_4286 [Cohaesibacter sp. ES.047]
MRRTYKALKADQSEIPANWQDALRVAKGTDNREMTDEDREQMIIAIADEMDKQFGKPVAEAARRCPEALQIVLELRMGKEFGFMIETNAPLKDEDDDFPF